MNVMWYWHKCFVKNSDGEKYYIATMGQYQMIAREDWTADHKDLMWKPLVAKWDNDSQLYHELANDKRYISFELHKDINDCIEFLQKWYVTYVLADQLILGEVNATDINTLTGGTKRL